MALSQRCEPHHCLGAASEQVRAFADVIRVGIAETGPNSNNPWLAEIPELVRTMPLDRTAAARIEELGRQSTVTLMWSVTDHLYAMSNCVADRTLFSVSSLARIVLEAAARTVWLNDSNSGAKLTLARHVTFHRKSIKDERDRLKKAKRHIGSGELYEHLDGLLDDCKSQIAECTDVLDRLGPDSDPESFSMTAIINEALTQANLVGMAPVSFSAHSAIVHSQPYMLLKSLNASGEPHPDMLAGRSMTVEAKLGPVLEALGVSIAMINSASRWWDNTVDTSDLVETAAQVWTIGHQHHGEPSQQLPS